MARSAAEGVRTSRVNENGHKKQEGLLNKRNGYHKHCRNSEEVCHLKKKKKVLYVAVLRYHRFLIFEVSLMLFCVAGKCCPLSFLR